MKNSFGTDGIRQKSTEFTNDFLFKLGQGLSLFNCNNVFVGIDTRNSSQFLAFSIISGLLSVGMDVTYLSVVSTPIVIYQSFMHQCLGIMITASHNDYTYNGIKIINNGYKLSKAEQEILLDGINKTYNLRFSKLSFGGNLEYDYLSYLLSNAVMTNYKVCIDCANGGNYMVAQEVFSKVCKEASFLGVKPNGININEGVGSSYIDNLKAFMLNGQFDFGFSYDGDGDRIICIDKNFDVLDGDMIILIIAYYLKKHNLLKNNCVALTIMSNLGVIKALRKLDISVIQTDVGDSNVLKCLLDNDLSLGGEASGHIIHLDYLPTGDGLYISTLLLKIFNEMDDEIYKLIKSVKLYHHKMINIKVKDKSSIVDNIFLKKRISDIKFELAYDCKIILRASGTEDVIRLSVMAQDEDVVDKYISELKSWIASI